MSDNGETETPPNATVYVRNLDERTKIPALIVALREIFEEYGNIVDIIAKKSVRRKGQAFVVYDSIESAQEAIDELQGFDLFGQQMTLDFAKTKSDATVKREGGEEAFEAHKKHRLAEKERKQAFEAAKATVAPPKRTADSESTFADRPAKANKPAQSAGGLVPDEYLPVNKILFVRDLPEDYGTDAVTSIFSRFPGFKELRTVPGRAGIAFAEYETEDGAIAARSSMNGIELSGQSIKVTYQRQ
ncbi:hypothetical protein B0A50_00433 [Salinomyces thailandicus]|uniref:RRM domain-containing protein n=1 Tax=Salinomyces thailandicus TaxID=706561 RepID=A0A4U0UEA4_9PEZI|nr:hypothetical protein B0A50_00433 [Salinomyces thailandica]